MKTFFRVAVLLGVWLISASDIAPDSYGGWTPFFMERAELERSVFYADKPREMNNPGKIWVDGDNIYVVEQYKGVHIVDNSNPAAPVNSRFIVVPGCMDIAIKSGTAYLDNAVDLVAFDLASGTVTKRIRNYFPEPINPAGSYYYNSSNDKIVVGWKQVVSQTVRP